MPESLEQNTEFNLPEEDLGGQEPPQEGSIKPNYGTLSFIDEDVELNFLQRLQTNGELNGLNWDPIFAARSNFLENKKNAGPSEDQVKRFNELSKIQAEGGSDWTPKLQEEIAGLYPLMDKRNKK